MKGKLYLINIITTIAFFVLTTYPEPVSLIFAIVFGGLLGIGEYFYLNKYQIISKNKYLLIDLILGIIICYFLINQFYNNYIKSHAINSIVGKFFSNYSNGLLVISLLIGTIALIFIVNNFRVIIPSIIHVLCTIKYKKVWFELIQYVNWFTSLKKIGMVTIHIFITALLGLLLLIGVYSLPIENININVESSSRIIKKENTYPILSNWFTSRLDNFTDSIILLEAANNSPNTVLSNAMKIPRGEIKDKNPTDTLLAYYLEGHDYDNIYTYPRYWHGYLIFIKPLLEIMNYGSIRIINGFLQIILVLVVCFLLFKNGYKEYVIPYILCFFMMMPLALAKCLQFSPCHYIYSLGCISLFVIKDIKCEKLIFLIFLYIGILTAFFDLLTYPIATLGVPMLFYLILFDVNSLEQRISSIIKYCCFWCIGFGGMWATKWLIASIITDENVIVDGINTLIYRTSTLSPDGSVKFGAFSSEIMNYTAFLKTPVTIITFIYLDLLLYKIVNKKDSINNVGKILFPFLIIALTPVAWYAFAINQTTIHYWFTNKNCVVSIMALLFALTYLLRINQSQSSMFTE